MNVKSKLLSFVVIVFLFVNVPIYSRSPWTNSEEKTTNSEGIWNNSASDRQSTNDFSSNVNRGPEPPPVEPPGQSNNVSPIGEGLAILCFISCGYFIIKKRNSKQLV